MQVDSQTTEAQQPAEEVVTTTKPQVGFSGKL